MCTIAWEAKIIEITSQSFNTWMKKGFWNELYADTLKTLLQNKVFTMLYTTEFQKNSKYFQTCSNMLNGRFFKGKATYILKIICYALKFNFDQFRQNTSNFFKTIIGLNTLKTYCQHNVNCFFLRAFFKELLNYKLVDTQQCF